MGFNSGFKGLKWRWLGPIWFHLLSYAILTELLDAFRNFANAPKTRIYNLFPCIECCVNGKCWDEWKKKCYDVMVYWRPEDLGKCNVHPSFRRAVCLLFYHSVSTALLFPFISEALLSLKQSRSTTCILWRHLYTCHPLWPDSRLGSVPRSHVCNPSLTLWKAQN